jgi:hypothetical protein
MMAKIGAIKQGEYCTTIEIDHESTYITKKPTYILYIFSQFFGFNFKFRTP